MAGLKDVIESSGMVGKVLEGGAPILASILGTPLAGIVVSLLADIFGTPSHDVPSVVDAIAKDPNAATKLRELEIAHADSLAKIASTDYYTKSQDVQDARKYGASDKGFVKVLAIVVTIGFFATMIALFFPMVLPTDEKNLLLLLVGNLSSKWQTIIDYFYGSSRPQPSQGATK